MKKIVSLVLTAVLTTAFIGPVAHAEDIILLNVDPIYDKVDKKDQKIQKEIDQAVNQAQHLIDQFHKDVEKLERDEDGLQKHPEKYTQLADKLKSDIEKLIKDVVNNTDKIAAKIVRDAAKKGVTVINEYILIQIGDQYVLIDPIRVLND